LRLNGYIILAISKVYKSSSLKISKLRYWISKLRAREGCDSGTEVGTVHSERDGKGQFLLENRRNLAEKGVVKKDFVSKKSSECA